jgi:hypothetical protein
MTDRELMERIATCDPTLLLMHIEEDTAYDAAILGKVFELAKEQARAALASSDAQADGGKSEAVYQVRSGYGWIDVSEGEYSNGYQDSARRIVYTTPQAECAPREGLSDERIHEVIAGIYGACATDQERRLARAIEQAAKEKA